MATQKSEMKRLRESRILYSYISQVLTDSRGFTLTEIIMVIILVGILAVSAVPKFMDTSAFSLEGAAAVVVADIRYTQELAMSEHTDKSITFAAGATSYTVDSRMVNLPSRVSINCVSGTGEFKFNSLGEPIIGGGKLVKIEAGDTGDTCKNININEIGTVQVEEEFESPCLTCP